MVISLPQVTAIALVLVRILSPREKAASGNQAATHTFLPECVLLGATALGALPNQDSRRHLCPNTAQVLRFLCCLHS